MVRIHVWTPQHISSEERQILESFRESDSFTPKPDSESGKKSFFHRVKDVFAS
jgi:molecular chaperone DnaJ